MLQALVLTAAIICTVLAALQWFVFLVDTVYDDFRNSSPTLTWTIPAIFLWVIYCHL